MSTVIFKPGRAEAAATTLYSLANSEYPNKIIELYELCKAIGEDNPLFETAAKNLMALQDKFNSELVPCINTVISNLNDNEDFAKKVTQLQGASVTMDSEIGTVERHEYNAAAFL